MALFIYSIGGLAVLTDKPAKQTIAGSAENANYAFLEIEKEAVIKVLKQGDMISKFS